MLTLILWALISVLLTIFTGLLFSFGSRRDSDDAAQLEYLSHWSDLKRLQK